MSFSTFIITEKLKTRSLVALHGYDERYKHDIIKDLSQRLLDAWKDVIRIHKPKASKEAIEDAVFRSTRACTSVEIIAKPVKLYAAVEHGRTQLVSPSVNIPLILAEHDRQLIRRAILVASAEVFTELKTHWHAIFMHETPAGRLVSDFSITQDNHAVMLHLSYKEDDVIHRVSLFHVTIENGKPGSKVRDHDIAYLSIDR
jgi:hypothetical protein